MNVQKRSFSGILVLSALLSIMLPFRTLFTGDGAFSWHLTQPKFYSMMAEIGILLLLLSLSFWSLKTEGQRILAASVVSLSFVWLHESFLPMTVSALYLGYLLLLGRWFRRLLLKTETEHRLFTDFLLGAGLVLSEFCVLSAFRAGAISVLRLVCMAQGAVLYGCLLWEVYKNRRQGEKKEQYFSNIGRRERLLLVLILVMVLIQIGKMNITLDFDTLWYGVRSEYILDFGTGIYENPGLVGMAYVYSKGLETLLLPLSDLVSHSYLLFFNIWLTVFGLYGVYRIARFYMGRSRALLAAALMSAVPGLMNMSISAKPDVITWLLQLMMVLYLLTHIRLWEEGRKSAVYLILAAGAYLLSLTMKPTALVFSTAIFGMAGLYLIFTRRISLRAPLRRWLLLLPAAAALTGIWARTMMITGMPVTSVFTSIFARLGFQMKYPFATGALPQNWQDESNLHVLFRRLYQMLLQPEGKDMGHVIIAWGTSLLFFLLALIAVYVLVKKKEARTAPALISFYHVVFWPFAAVNLISLVMLYQVDGNYFILLYTAVVLSACRCLDRVADMDLRRLAFGLLVPLLAFNLLISAASNWAWTLGFSGPKLLNSGRVDHEALQRQTMVDRGNEEIWKILEQDPKTRVIAFADHPTCLNFPCMVQSYKDITSPWGNVELVNTPEAFEEYMAYTKADYIYAEAGYIGENEWSWSYGLLQDLIKRGSLTELRFEHGNLLARVGRAGDADQAEENLRLFMENYRPAQ